MVVVFFVTLYIQPSKLLHFNPRNSHSLLFLHEGRGVNLVDSHSRGRNTDRVVDMPAAGQRAEDRGRCSGAVDTPCRQSGS